MNNDYGINNEDMVNDYNLPNNELYDQPEFISPHVGGINLPPNAQTQIRNQLSVLKNQYKKIPKNYKNITPKNNVFKDLYSNDNPGLFQNQDQHQSQNQNNHNNDFLKYDSYDPYVGYLFRRGLLTQDYTSHYNINYINIDSSQRQIQPITTLGSTYLLSSNPLAFTQGSSQLTITQQNHTFLVNDRISISNVPTTNIQLKTSGIVYIDTPVVNTIYDSNNIIVNRIGTMTVVQQTNHTIFEFTTGSAYMKFYYTHYLPIQPVFSVNQYNSDILSNPSNTFAGFSNDPFYSTFNTSNLFVQISGITGNGFGIIGGSFFDNIPINMINTTHSVILPDPITGVILRNVFFIKLPKEYIPSPTPTYPNGQFQTPNPAYSFKMSFLYIAGIPVNLINTEYPLNSTHLVGFQTIVATTQNTYTINLEAAIAGVADASGALSTNSTGGSKITITQVLDVQQGYAEPNQYNIQLGTVFSNITLLRLVNSIFPYTETPVRSVITSPTNSNNKIYWTNLDDGNYVYSVAIPSGTYDAPSLKQVLESSFYNTPRINYAIDNPSNPSANYVQVSAPYTNHNYITVDINVLTDIVTFSSYKQIFLFQPIKSIDPTITTNLAADPSVLTNYVLTINHPAHNLNVGDSIIISNAIDTMGIPASIINQSQTILAVVDSNNYRVQLQTTNLSSTRVNTYGGVNVQILSPNTFLLDFSYANTLGGVLGFRNPASATSITSFGTTIQNSDPYQFELELGIAVSNNALNLKGYSYILMVCDQIQTMVNIGKIKNVFAKITLNNSNNNQKYTVLFDTFVQMTQIYYNPIPNIAELDFSFYTPDGYLYDFNGEDHSFVLQLISIDETPSETNISARTGKVN
jgi:hypothetical protein